MIVVEPKDQPKKYKSVASHLTIELTDKPMRYTACPSVDKKDGVWAATGINMAGVGMTATVSEKDLKTALAVLNDSGVKAYVLGEIVKSEDGVIIC